MTIKLIKKPQDIQNKEKLSENGSWCWHNEIEEEVCVVCGTKINVYWIYTIGQKWKTMKEVCLMCKQRKDDERKL